jgi:hypothetical protein
MASSVRGDIESRMIRSGGRIHLAKTSLPSCAQLRRHRRCQETISYLLASAEACFGVSSLQQSWRRRLSSRLCLYLVPTDGRLRRRRILCRSGASCVPALRHSQLRTATRLKAMPCRVARRRRAADGTRAPKIEEGLPRGGHCRRPSRAKNPPYIRAASCAV